MQKSRMRRVLLVFGMLAAAGCSGSDEQAANSPKVAFVEPYAGDPSNYTSAGFQRHVYPVEDCGTEIPLNPPFQIGDNGGGFGVGDIHAPISLLDDATAKVLAPEGISTQERLSFAYPSLDRGIGMVETFAQGQSAGVRRPMPIATIAQALAASDPEWSNPTFTGTVGGRLITAECLSGERSNPFCIAEIHIGSEGRRYRAIFPIHAAARLKRIVEVGDELFARAEAVCSAR